MPDYFSKPPEKCEKCGTLLKLFKDVEYDSKDRKFTTYAIGSYFYTDPNCKFGKQILTMLKEDSS